MKIKLSRLLKINVTLAILLLILAAIFFVTFRATIYFINNNPFPNAIENKVQIEVIKSLLGIMSITVIGGVVTALIKGYERFQEQSKVRIQSKIEFMKRVGELYRLVKSIRRKLNAGGIKATENGSAIALGKEQIQFYKIQMEVLDGVQLEIEGLKTAVERFAAFNYNSHVSFYLGKMEKYLRKILNEFADNIELLKTQDYVNLNSLRFLKEFTFDKADNKVLYEEFKKEEEREYCFKREFSYSYNGVLSNLS
jgi:hypothetical protein